MITTKRDLTDYVYNYRADLESVGGEILVKKVVDCVQGMDHPPWGTDWSKWLPEAIATAVEECEGG